MPPDTFGEEVAARYDEMSGAMFHPDVVGPTVDVLAQLAGEGGALEFAVGTGRVALALAARGAACPGSSSRFPWPTGYGQKTTLIWYR